MLQSRLFALADHGVDRVNVTAGFSLIFVYMIFPLQALLTNLPQISLARTSARRINGLADEMDFEYTESASSVPAQHGLLFEHTLTLESLTFSHVQTGTNAALSVGPLDMTFRRGELTFLVGGNGSGKTTIAKLISGLYAPDAGQILVDGRPVRETGRAAYRENFSAVFSDYHLFESLLQINGPEYDARANALLGNLGLLHKVNVRGGSFSTIALSQGERKRLAMVVALLEDRPAYIFDEWAADQDPSFKGVFYREILPDLRDRGKLVIVISHDDRYFDAADQIVWIENGRVDRYRINEPENSRLAVTTD